MLKKIGLLLFLAILVLAPFFAARASDAKSSNYGLDQAASTGGLPKGAGGAASASLALEAGRVIGALLAFLGVIFLVLMIAGGIMWMTAAGNDSRVKTAQSLIRAAIIGLVIVLSSYAITTFVADNFLAK